MTSYHVLAYSLLRRQYSFMPPPPVLLDLEKTQLAWNKNPLDLKLFKLTWIMCLFNGVGLFYSLSYFVFDRSTYNFGLVAFHMANGLALFGMFAVLCLLWRNPEFITGINSLITLHEDISTGILSLLNSRKISLNTVFNI